MADSLFSYGSKILTGTASISIGTPNASYPASNLNDNVMATVASIPEVTGAFSIDLGAEVLPDFLACFNHNITTGVTRVQGSNVSDFSSLIVNQLVSITSLPNFWQDLRSISPRTCRYWRVNITSNAVALDIGEIILGTFVTVRSFNWDYTDTFDFLIRDHGTTEWGAFHYAKRGLRTRGRSLKFLVPDNQHAILRDYLYSVGAPTKIRPSIFVPLDNQSDVWMLEPVSEYDEDKDIDRMQTITFDVIELISELP